LGGVAVRVPGVPLAGHVAQLCEPVDLLLDELALPCSVPRRFGALPLQPPCSAAVRDARQGQHAHNLRLNPPQQQKRPASHRDANVAALVANVGSRRNAHLKPKDSVFYNKRYLKAVYH